MTDHHEETPRKNDPITMTPENVPRSSPNCKCEVNQQPVKPSAFDHLLKQNEAFFWMESRFLAAIAARIGVPRSDVEDVVAEVWVSVVKHRDKLVGAVDLKKQLHCLLRKIVQDKARDRRRHLQACPCQSLSGEGIEPSDEPAIKRAELAEIREWLEVRMMKASRGNKANLFLARAHFFDELSIPELAKQCGLTPKSVDGRIRRLEQRMYEAARGTFQQ